MNQYQIDRNQWAAKKYVCAVCASFLLTSTINQAKFNKSMLHRPPSHLSEKTVLLPCKLRKPELSLQGQRKSLPSSGSDHLLEIISMSHEHDVQVVVSWRLVALKVPCTSCFLGQYGRVSERRGGQLESCSCSSWLGATMACSGGQTGVVIWCRKTQISDGRTRKAGREWHQWQHLSSEHSVLSCLIKHTAFGNTCIITCLSLLHAHTAAKVSGSEFCNIQLACHLILPWFRSLTLSEFQDVSGSSWESVDPNASHYKVGFTWVHNLTSKISTH